MGGQDLGKLAIFRKKRYGALRKKKFAIGFTKAKRRLRRAAEGFSSGACGGLIFSVYFCIRRGLCFKKISPAAPFNLVFLSEKKIRLRRTLT